jgi:hypothetical protein
MVVSTVNTNVNRNDGDDYDETDNSSQEESEYEFSEEEDEEADDNSEVSEEEEESDTEEESLPPVATLPARNIVAPVRLIDEQQRFTQGIYHGRVDQWDRNFNGHKPE